MSLVDLLLNLVGLLMWVSWRGINGLEAAGSAGTILGNVRPAERIRQPRWGYLVGLLGMLLFRAIVYRQVGPAVPWHPTWSVAAVTIPFRSDSFPRMLSYSFVSFGWLLLNWYTWGLAVLAINRAGKERDGVTRVIRRQMGWVGSLPAPILILLPMLGAGVGWMLVGWLAAEYRMLPSLQGGAHLLQQGVVMGMSHLCVLRWLLVGVLLFHLLNLYVYLGSHAFWDFAQQTGERLTRPFRFARLGQLDMSPIPAALAILGGFNLVGYGFPWLRSALPGMPDWIEFGLLPTLFRSLPLG